MAENIYVYKPDTLEPVGILEDIPSLQWTRRWAKPGEFEIHIQGETWLEEEDILERNGDVAMVEGIAKSYTSEAGEQAVVTGRFLSAYAERRIIPGIQSITGTHEYVMKQLVTRCMTTAGERAFPLLAVAASHGYATGTLEQQTENAKLLETLEDVAMLSALGFHIKKVGAVLVFDVAQGVNRTNSQAVNARVQFSIEDENILSQKMKIDTVEKRNFAYITMPQTGDAPEVSTTYGTVTGRERREMFVNGSNVAKDEDGNSISSEQQIVLLQAQGQAALREEIMAFEATIDQNGALSYKTDYDLGDIVTIVARKWGVQIDAQITEVKEIVESGKNSIKITFGYDEQSFKKIVKRWLV